MECEGLYRHAVPPGRQLSLLRKYRLGDIPGLVVKGRRVYKRLRNAYLDY